MNCCCMQDAAPAMARNADHAAVDLDLDLSAAQHVWISQTTLALLLRSGQMVLVHLTVEAGFVRQMKVSHCGSCCLALLVQCNEVGIARTLYSSSDKSFQVDILSGVLSSAWC